VITLALLVAYIALLVGPWIVAARSRKAGRILSLIVIGLTIAVFVGAAWGTCPPEDSDAQCRGRILVNMFNFVAGVPLILSAALCALLPIKKHEHAVPQS
jgi:hypothetical protein